MNLQQFVAKAAQAIVSDPDGGFNQVCVEFYMEKARPILGLLGEVAPDLSVKLVEDLGPLYTTLLSSYALLHSRKDVQSAMARAQEVNARRTWTKFLAFKAMGFNEDQAFALILAEAGQPSMAKTFLENVNKNDLKKD